MTEEEKKETGKVTRREFLKDAGLVVGGAAIGSTVLLAACGEGEGATETVTTTVTETVSKFVCPSCSQEFDTLAALQAHFEAEHPAEGVPEEWAKLTVNGQTYELKIETEWTLLFVLREKLGLYATKQGCNRAECGSCTVIVDSRAVLACTILAIESEGRDILTLEGLSDGITLSPVQQAFYDFDAHQCGYCTPGFIMSAKVLLDENPKPTRDEVREALSGNLCTCGGVPQRAIEAILSL